MRIGFFDLEGWEEQAIRQALPAETDLFLSKEKIDDFNLPERRDFDGISIFVTSHIDETVLNALPNLKFIATRSTGYDHIDMIACQKRGITVSFVPGYGDNTVAEYAFGLILSLTRKLYPAMDRIKETGSFALDGLRGMDIKDKTLGVIGTGRIGKEMIKMAKGFGMKIAAFDPFPDAQFAEAQGFEYVSLEALLSSSHVITIHCPLNEKTTHLINKENISSIKRGAYLVNTARGGIVETDALVEALESGILAGAGIDVLEEEGDTKDELEFLHRHPKEDEMATILANHALMRMPNVLMTPHNAFNTNEALERILKTTLESVNGFATGAPVNLVPVAK
jgi:D-lactate dehydrogenase